ncbi:hypothetical protein L1987_45275 [Smallanthus sonchifolius]|uniref:Uncharacterized protein n=1 Tax=Smallanthus sonchifolius TaxID=185202 RepID=A0ACB9GR75_9ASTR|nr:hypothetical protein L1987_45275 [Smallanthus sonchifolius]
MGNENRDIAPVLLKFGVALALSLGGVVYTLIINKRSKASQSPHDPHGNRQVNPRSNHLHFDSLATDKHEDLNHSNNTKSLQENIESPEGYSCLEKDTHEQEIKNLRNTVRVLKERENNLEIELLEYYGLKEQETAVMELQNCLKLNNMEAKLFALKIESLQADNRRLEEQMTDYKKVVADLEAARTKIKMLKKNIKLESEKNKTQISDFQQEVQKMQEDEHKIVSEVEELRKTNHNLELENTDLAHRLDCVQILATSVLEDGENEKIKEESQNLKKQNEDLSKENERLQAERCGDVEELVYLRWINACLRYELRNYQPRPSKTTARDLSKKLSPRSEEKAKQLIVEYADKEGGIDSEQWSISQASIITDSGEFDETFIDDQLRHKNNNTFFGKLMRVIRGKDHSHNNSPNHHNHQRNHSRNSSVGKSESGGDDIVSCGSSENQRLKTLSGGSKRLTHRHSDSSFYKQVDSDAGGGPGGRRRRSFSSGGQKSELAKYAEALKDSRAKSNFKSHKSSPSLCFF